MTEPIDLENIPVHPEFYLAIGHCLKIVQAMPHIRDILYFKLHALRNEIEDV